MKVLAYILIGLWLWEGMIPQRVVGQPCMNIEDAAKALRVKRDAEVKRNDYLIQEIDAKKSFISLYGYTQTQSPYNLENLDFNDSNPKYHDDRIHYQRCKQLWDRDWGKIKDWRELNIDKYQEINEVLALELIRLNHLLDSLLVIYQQKKGPAKTSPPTVKPTPPPTVVSKPIKVDHMKMARLNVDGRAYRYCKFNPKQVKLAITSRTKGFADLRSRLAKEGRELLLAMNAGMYEPNRRPVGLLVAGGSEIAPLNMAKGTGNFYMYPNGIFGLYQDGTPFIMTRGTFFREEIPIPNLALATQSGPALVLKRKINPKFNPNSSNKYFRNGVGITPKGEVIFAISDQLVNFYEFAALFLELGCSDALYLDGAVSRMYVPNLNENQDLVDTKHLGPVLYIYKQR